MTNTNNTGSKSSKTQCEWCGEKVNCDMWHPVASGTAKDGTFQLFRFCSEECRENWVTEQDTAPS
ncbi:DUF7576 family protein [Haloarcula amylovorans]